MVAQQQLNAKLGLKLADRNRDRGLRDVHQFCGFGDGTIVDTGDEILQLAQGVFVHLSIVKNYSLKIYN